MRTPGLLALTLLLMPLVAGAGMPDAPPACPDPVTGCRLADGVTLRFSQAPKPMQTFELEVTAVSRQPLHASFEMRDMDMGVNRYRLLPKDGKWYAQVMLPACMSGHDEWVMRLEVDGKVYEMPFLSR